MINKGGTPLQAMASEVQWGAECAELKGTAMERPDLEYIAFRHICSGGERARMAVQLQRAT